MNDRSLSRPTAARTRFTQSEQNDQRESLSDAGGRTPTRLQRLRLQAEVEGGTSESTPTEGSHPKSTPKTQ